MADTKIYILTICLPLRYNRGMRNTKYTKEFLTPLVASSKSVSEMLRKCKISSISGGMHAALAARIRQYKLDTSHFTGARWNKGLTKNDHPAIANYARHNTLTDKEVFKKDSKLTKNSALCARLKKYKTYACVVCKIDSWLGKPLRLHVHHHNGGRNDNRRSNIDFICPNCHSQTDSYARIK